MSRGLSLKTTCDLCVAFSLFSSFMFPLRMNNPSSQSCVPSFQTLTFFLTQFQSSLSILRCPCSISSGSSLPPKVINLFLSQESVSGLQETFFLLDHQLCRATENRRVCYCKLQVQTTSLHLFCLENKVGKHPQPSQKIKRIIGRHQVCTRESPVGDKPRQDNASGPLVGLEVTERATAFGRRA